MVRGEQRRKKEGEKEDQKINEGGGGEIARGPERTTKPAD
jgi:hypothetical protein